MCQKYQLGHQFPIILLHTDYLDLGNGEIKALESREGPKEMFMERSSSFRKKGVLEEKYGWREDPGNQDIS